MANIINASTSGTSGLITSADASGIISFQKDGSSTLTINESGAIGVGSVISYGTAGQALTSNGAGNIPVWTTITGGATLTNDITSNTIVFPVFTGNTTGTMTSASVANTKFYFNPSTGTVSATIFNSLSDINSKNNIITISNGLNVIKQINAVEYDWKDGSGHSSGVIAQQLESILPFLVVTNDREEKSVNYSGIIAYLISAVNELSDKVEKLENK